MLIAVIPEFNSLINAKFMIIIIFIDTNVNGNGFLILFRPPSWSKQFQSWVADFRKIYHGDRSLALTDLPIVRLRGVTDQYPPQKKSFMMLKHMYENYGDK